MSAVNRQEALDWLAENLDEWQIEHDICLETVDDYHFPVFSQLNGFLSSVTVAGYTFSHSDWEQAKKDKENEWNGEGLPPVGVELEFMYRRASSSGWEWGKLIAIDNNNGWLRSRKWDDQVVTLEDYEFRPIRSTADKARDKALAAIKEACPNKGSWDSVGSVYADAIYDAIAAGKIPGVKLEAE